MKNNEEIGIDELDVLTPAELIILQGHLKLGVNHFKKHLNEQEMNALFRLGEAKKETLEKKSHRTEILGNLVLPLNTVFTGIFGAWMGVSGFCGFNLGSPFTFGIVVLFALLVGVFIGYYSFKNIKQLLRNAIHKQQINDLQSKILDKIYTKRQKEIEEITNDLNHSLSFLAKSTGDDNDKKIIFLENKFKSKKQILEWLSALDAIIQGSFTPDQKHHVYEIYSNNLREIQAKLGKSLKDCFQGSEGVEVIHVDPSGETKKNISPLLEKLITQLPLEPVNSLSWIRSNWQELIISFVPTILGGFASTFVYLGGGPQIFKALGNETLFNILSDPKIKVIEFFVSIFMTSFLAYSFIHVNHQLIKRHEDLEKIQNVIIQKEGLLTIFDARLLKLKDARNSMVQILDIFSALERISKFLSLLSISQLKNLR